MADVLVLGGYGGVGRHAARTLAAADVRVLVGGRRRAPGERLAAELDGARALVVDAAEPAAVRAAAERVHAVVNCSGQETVALVDAVRAGGAHLVDVSANHAFQRAVTEQVAPGGACEVLFSVGVAPGLTNLLAAAVAATTPGPLELLVALGVGEDHGRASRDWVYGLLGRRFPDTTGRQRQVRNFTDRARRRLPHLGTCWLYRADVSDQHVLTADLARPVLTRLGFDSQAITWLMAALGRVPRSGRLLRAVEPAMPWRWLGADRWVITVGPPGRVTGWMSGRHESHATGVVAGLATRTLLDGPVPGVTHLHRRSSLATLAGELTAHGIELAV